MASMRVRSEGVAFELCWLASFFRIFDTVLNMVCCWTEDVPSLLSCHLVV